jgi:ribosomal-protein-alanine acetyltransferase
MTVSMSQAGVRDAWDIYQLEVVLFPHDAWSRHTISAELSHPDSFYLVLREDESKELVGYGGLRTSQAPGGQGDIQTMAVAPSHQGKGLGGMLLDALLTQAWRRGVDEVFLDVRADNNIAKGLYERAGFREIARRSGYYQPGHVDAIVMHKARDDRSTHE